MILVFGGGGQLGQELARAAEGEGVALKALTRAEADIADPSVAQAIEAARPSLIVNAGAYTNVDKAETDIAQAQRVNERGPAVLATACREANIPLIHISTDYVFDGTRSGAYVEDDPISPIGVYGRTKASGEEAVRNILPHHVILRTSWLYGRFGSNFLKTMMRLAREREELRVVADQRGCPTSTWDLARAILTMAPRLVDGEEVWGTYHFAGTGATTWYGFAERIIAGQAPLTGLRPAVIPIKTEDYPTPARRPANSELSSDHYANTFGFRAEPWHAAVDRTIHRLLSE